MIKAGFAEIDITPPVGTCKIGWIIKIVSASVADPLYARAAVFTANDRAIAFIQLDTLCVRWTQVNDIRARIERQCGFPGGHIMVAATHNHAGPAVANSGETQRDPAYLETLTQRCVTVFGQALAKLQAVEIGAGHVFEWRVAHNRRVVMRDGTANTHGSFNSPDALFLEGPIDPELFVLAARTPDGKLIGSLINYTCHPTHHGGDAVLSAGYPGVLAARMKSCGCPVPLFLNGACGNVHTSDPTRGGAGMDMAEAGNALAEDTQRILATLTYRKEATLAARSRTVQLPYRAVTDDEVRGTVRGAQRFVKPECYDRGMPELLDRIRTRGTQPAEVQVLSIAEFDFAGIPAEYFVEHGLRIKQGAHPRHALVVGHTNGMIGYVPTAAAFTRGGYETTFSSGHKLAPPAGDLLADTAIALIAEAR